MTRVRWDREALAQLKAIFDYIAQDDVDAAAWVRGRIRERAGQLRHFPELGPVGRIEGTRELVILITKTPYVVVYRVLNTEVRVLAVWRSSESRARR